VKAVPHMVQEELSPGGQKVPSDSSQGAS
jgi:hypothetical protein